jgi:tRNA(fMet)-specific endonuclease VapC
MSGRYLLDTNIIIDLFRGDSKAIARVNQIEVIYVPVIVIGELYFGANRSNQLQKRTSEIEQLEKIVTILEISRTTAQIYGRIKEQLLVKGKPIPENDIWIAAIAAENKMVLITRDGHFEQVDGIMIEKL